MFIPPLVITTITTSLAALIPKAVSDAYDYFFNGEEIQVRKKADKTTISTTDLRVVKLNYEAYLRFDGTFKTQKELYKEQPTVNNKTQ